MKFIDHLYIKLIYAGFLLNIYQNILYSVLSLTCLNFLKMAAWKALPKIL